MNRLATRYAPALVVVALLGLVPVVVHSYIGVESDDCRSPATLIPPGARSAERHEWMQRHFDSTRWTEGTLPGQPILQWAIVRSWDPKRTYNRPYRAFARGTIAVGQRVETLPVGDVSLPVHRPVFDPRSGKARNPVALYALVYDGRPVSNAYWAQLRAAPSLAFRGTLPMTLLMVSGFVTEAEREAALERARGWLADAWLRYQSACAD